MPRRENVYSNRQRRRMHKMRTKTNAWERSLNYRRNPCKPGPNGRRDTVRDGNHLCYYPGSYPARPDKRSGPDPQ
jgi:hypothetical protein